VVQVHPHDEPEFGRRVLELGGRAALVRLLDQPPRLGRLADAAQRLADLQQRLRVARPLLEKPLEQLLALRLLAQPVGHLAPPPLPRAGGPPPRGAEGPPPGRPAPPAAAPPSAPGRAAG